ncbi:MAG: type II toxin-antitoxin system Phd/YefM family antitoxin [Egibacteraceae bacterium]
MTMADVSATDAARNFAGLLDAVERGEQFTIIRRGRVVAHLEPMGRGRGAAVKTALRRHAVDADWASDVTRTRRLLSVEERP